MASLTMMLPDSYISFSYKEKLGEKYQYVKINRSFKKKSYFKNNVLKDITLPMIKFDDVFG